MGNDNPDRNSSEEKSPRKDDGGDLFSNLGQKRSQNDSDRSSSPSANRKKSNYTLFVGNLPFSTSEAELGDFFSDNNCDFTSVRLMKDRETNKSKGFGYADFANEEDMKKAIRLNGSDLGGRDVKIDYAQKDNNAEESTTIYVGNLSYNTNEDSLKNFLDDNQIANVKEIRLIKDNDGNSKGFAYIEFDDVPSAATVVELNNSDLDGRSLRINFENKKRRGGGGGFGGRGGGRGGFGDRDRRGGGGGYGDRDRRGGGGYGDRDRRGGGGSYGGDRDRRSGGSSGGYGDRDRRGGGGGSSYGGDRDRRDRYERRN